MEIRSLDKLGFDVIFESFSQAFADYEIQQTKAGLTTMLTRRGFCPERSFGAFDGDKLVSFTLNGVGEFQKVRTAYDTGTGTLKEYRGMGLASQVFTHSLPHLKSAGIKQYLLEVLQHNTKAAKVYRDLGFKESREFYYFLVNRTQVTAKSFELPANYQLKQVRVEECLPGAVFHDFAPSWQNSFDAILRKPDDFIAFGVFYEDLLAGYCITEPLNGDITQIAVDKKHRKRGLGNSLLARAVDVAESDMLKVVNTELQAEEFTSFLASHNIKPSGKQFEMVRAIS